MPDALMQLKSNSKLVVFIGAGASANSGYDSWNELVHKMDVALEYTPALNGKRYSNDELLRIP